MSTDQDLLTRLWAELREFAEPLLLAADGPEQRAELARRLGWDLDALGERLGVEDITTLDAQLTTWVAGVRSALAAVEELLDGGVPDSLEVAAEHAAAVGEAMGALRGLPQPWRATLPPSVLAHMGEDLTGHLLDGYLADRAPLLRRALALLGVLDPTGEGPAGGPDPDDAGRPVRLPHRRAAVHPDRLVGLFADPRAVLTDVYGPGDDLAALADALFPRIAALLTELGLTASYGVKAGSGPDVGGGTAEVSAHMLTVGGTVGAGDAKASWGASIALSPDESGGLGLVVVPHGEIDFTTAAGGWNLGAGVGAGGAAFAIGSGGLVVEGAGTEVDVELTAARRTAQDGPALRVGSATGTRFELDEFLVRLFARLRPNGSDYGLSVGAEKAALVVRPAADGDGFLATALKGVEFRVPITAALAWSRAGGLVLGGGASLDTGAVPLHLRLGPVTVEAVRLALAASVAERKLALSASTDLRFDLGPVRATVDGLGVTGELTFPDGGGNLGPAQLGVRFTPPTGVALRVDAGVVTGAGFLSFDEDAGRYAGGVDLEFAKVRLSALGLLTTRFPDGRSGFSLLLVVNARFPQPIPLGFGFNLASVGGLLGVNRSFDKARLQAAIGDGSLAAILAPGDVIGHETDLLGRLESIFPASPGRVVFGPTARLTWGTPAVITADLGLAVELPRPVRLVAMGRVRVLLPHEDAPVVEINLDAVGFLDFGEGTLDVDARLYDSRVLEWTLTGGMALRARWSGDGDFVLSAGGFHPRYAPPPSFPKLAPLALAIGNPGSAVSARFSSYLAITANTLQLGGRVEVHAKAGSFTADGAVGLDVLVQLDPFGFEVDLDLLVAVRWQGHLLLGVAASLHLRGPGEWHVRGRARVDVLFLSAEVAFESRFGRAPAPIAPAARPVLSLVRDALASPGAWQVDDQAALPAITVRPGAASRGLLVSPSSRITARQRVAPLGGLHLDHFGTAPIAGDARIAVTGADLGGRAAEVIEVRDPFARSQFFRLGDEERLAAPSFEAMPSGVVFTAAGGTGTADSAGTFVELGYRTTVVDALGATARLAAAGPDHVLTADELLVLAGGGAAGRAATRDSGTARFADPRLGLALDVRDNAYAVVDARTLTGVARAAAGPDHPAAATRLTRTEALDRLRRAPAGPEPLVVVPVSETADAVAATAERRAARPEKETVSA
ncbi:DUF6603 domain-containing protein [Saccharothrix sp. Mg75]|uniref:DUF6603 domain-containing protein n=1 Tax=Saccharothrix sp. Mg75 TaxID=3445357 RepID=UPI003EE9B7D4